MEVTEIKAVFDRTFNGMPNPIFRYPVMYFEHNGYLCELAKSATSHEMAEETRRDLHKSPLAMFGMMFGDCGAWLTVLTKDGERTRFGGHVESDEDLEALKEEIV